MEDNFNQNDFEEFLQDQVRNHRMYPSDAVWREIDKKLHGEKRWPALTIVASLLLAVTVLVCVYFTPKPNIFTIQPNNRNLANTLPGEKNILNNLTTGAPFSLALPSETASKNTGEKVTGFQQNGKQSIQSTESTSDQTRIKHTLHSSAKSKSPNAVNRVDATKAVIPTSSGSEVAIVEGDMKGQNALMIPDTATKSKVVKAAGTANIITTPVASANKEDSHNNIVDNFLKEHAEDIRLHNAPAKVSMKNKFSYQLYIAPSVSYRQLIEDNSTIMLNQKASI